MEGLLISSPRLGSASLGRLLGLLLLALSFCAPASAQGGRPDQLYVEDAKTGQVKIVAGRVTQDELDKVKYAKADGKERTLKGALVKKVVWGKSSAAFAEGRIYYDRGDYENASAKFQLAATSDEREVLQVAARLMAARSLMEWGSAGATHYEEAASEFERFLTDNPTSREVPLARSLQARNARLGGDDAAAGTLYRSLFEEGTGSTPTEGYDKVLCLKSGLEAARALLSAGDTLAAREIFGVLSNSASDAAGKAEEGSLEHLALEGLRDEALLGQGWVDLASKQWKQAETFFSVKGADPNASSVTRYGAMMGLAEAYLGNGEARKAQIEFAKVSALDHTDRDRQARATLLLAETTVALGGDNAQKQARAYATFIVEQLGNTPSARHAWKRLGEW